MCISVVDDREFVMETIYKEITNIMHKVVSRIAMQLLAYPLIKLRTVNGIDDIHLRNRVHSNDTCVKDFDSRFFFIVNWF